MHTFQIQGLENDFRVIRCGPARSWGWSGSSGNAEKPNEPSKHLHIYYRVCEAAGIPGNVGSKPARNAEKRDPARLFPAAETAVAAAAQKKNHYPHVHGKVLNSHGKSFGKKHVKVIADVKLPYLQRLTGRVVSSGGQPPGQVLVDVLDVGAKLSVGSTTTGADGRFDILAPAGKVKLRLGPTGAVTHDIAARKAGTNQDTGDLTL